MYLSKAISDDEYMTLFIQIKKGLKKLHLIFQEI